jgi:hypothetical protein
VTIREQAIRLCEYAANLDGNASISLDALVRDSEFVPESGDLADEACNEVCLDSDCAGLDWRELWAEAAQRLREGWEASHG